MVEVGQLLVRILHIVSGVMWVGGLFLWGMVIAPSVAKRVPPPARGPFMGTVLPRISRYFGIAGAVTVLTGFWTMGLIYEFENIVPVFQEQEAGRALGAGVVLSILMLVVAFGFIIPTANKLLDIMKNAPAPAPGAAPAAPPPHVVALQKRVMMGGMVNLLLGTIALVTMAWAVSARSGL